MNGESFVVRFQACRDAIDFLNLWVAEDPSADWDSNGEDDTRDFLAFLNDWTAGC